MSLGGGVEPELRAGHLGGCPLSYDIEFVGARRPRFWFLAAVFVLAMVGLVVADVRLKSSTDGLGRHDLVLHTITDDFHEIRVGTMEISEALEDYTEGHADVEAIREPYGSVIARIELTSAHLNEMVDPSAIAVLHDLLVEVGGVGRLIDSVDAGLPPVDGVFGSVADDLLEKSGELVDGADLVIGNEGFADHFSTALSVSLVVLPLSALLALLAMAVESSAGLTKANEHTKERLRDEDRSRRKAQRLALAQSQGMELVAAGATAPVIDSFMEKVLATETEDDTEPSPELVSMVDHVRLLASERDRVSEAMIHESTHDRLTGLHNRTSIVSATEVAMTVGHRHGPMAAVFVDIRRFKLTNDAYGHEIGDEVLRTFADRIDSVVGENGQAARIGGSKFAVLLDPATPERAQALAQQIIETTMRSYSVFGQHIELEVCAGLSFAGADDTDPDRLLREADTAMRHAFRTDQTMVCVNESLRALEESTSPRGSGRFVTSIRDDGIVALYQPLVDLATGRICGVEALARLRLGDEILTPDKFIEIAEDTGQIVDLDRRVLDIGSRQVARWNDIYATSIELAVNLSGAHAGRPDAMTSVLATARRSGLDPQSLVVEINEGVFLDDVEAVAGRLAPLRDAGIRVSIDDFGTGYSSLSYLQHLPVDILKIDQSFVARLQESSRDVALVRAIIDLAGALDLEVVAEGIEEAEQMEMLTAMGCAMGQGYLFDRPVNAATLEHRWLVSDLTNIDELVI